MDDRSHVESTTPEWLELQLEFRDGDAAAVDGEYLTRAIRELLLEAGVPDGAVDRGLRTAQVEQPLDAVAIGALAVATIGVAAQLLQLATQPREGAAQREREVPERSGEEATQDALDRFVDEVLVPRLADRYGIRARRHWLRRGGRS